MTLESLNNFLKNHQIPTSEKSVGFLEIIKKQAHENTISLIYAYFLNTNEREISGVFLEALLELIYSASGKKLTFLEPFAFTEEPTANGRVDILIKDLKGNATIIIESKINHWLHNDLLEYWNYFKVSHSNKVGILLTVNSENIGDEVKGKYYNITHSQWIEKVKELGIPDTLPVSTKVYLEDFFRTIDNLKNSYDMDEQAKFYFQNAVHVLKAKETLDAAQIFLSNQFELIAAKIGWQTYGSLYTWRNFWDGNNSLKTYLTIITEHLLEGKFQFSLILELYQEDRVYEEELINILKDHPKYKQMHRGNTKAQYIQFACKNYTITEAELEDFANVVVEKIHADFAEITLIAIKLIYPNANISSWEDKFLGGEKL